MKNSSKTLIIFSALVLIVLGIVWFTRSNNPPLVQEDAAIDRPTISTYFVEHMRVSPQEARQMAQDGVIFRVSDNTTLMGIKGNLYYYGFIDDEERFQSLLETTEDTTPGDENSIKVADNTIDVNSSYYLNYDLNEEEIADILLNKAQHEQNFSQYTYLFMPGGRPGADQK